MPAGMDWKSNITLRRSDSVRIAFETSSAVQFKGVCVRMQQTQ